LTTATIQVPQEFQSFQSIEQGPSLSRIMLFFFVFLFFCFFVFLISPVSVSIKSTSPPLFVNVNDGVDKIYHRYIFGVGMVQ